MALVAIKDHQKLLIHHFQILQIVNKSLSPFNEVVAIHLGYILLYFTYDASRQAACQSFHDGFPSTTAVRKFKCFPLQTNIDLPGSSFSKITDIMVKPFTFRYSGLRCCGCTPCKFYTFVRAVWLQSRFGEVAVS